MIADSSQHVYSWDGYIYGDKVAELKEELPTKLSLTNAAGMNGKRIGENFQDIVRLVVTGELSEDDEGNPTDKPLRLIVKEFRSAHRAEVGKKKLYLNSAADSRPAEFVFAAIEAVTGLKWEAPMTRTDFEVSFVAEPERWFDDPQTVNLLQNPSGSSPFNDYAVVVTYDGPDTDFYADAEALPVISLTVSSLDTGQLGTADPPYIQFVNAQDSQSFKLFPDGNNQFVIDSYEQGIRKGATFSGGTIYEMADYDQFLYLVGGQVGAGVANNLSVVCKHCNMSVCSMVYYPRHW